MTESYNIYKYYCQTEKKFIIEKRLSTAGNPSLCMNNNSHTIDINTLTLYKRGDTNTGPKGDPGPYKYTISINELKIDDSKKALKQFQQIMDERDKAYATVTKFVFYGSTATPITTFNMIVDLIENNSEIEVRIFDVTNANEIISIPKITGKGNNNTIITSTNISNVPTNPAIFEVQVKSTEYAYIDFISLE